MPITEYILKPHETEGTPLIPEAAPTSPLIAPEAQLELAQNGSIVIALFTFYLIVHEARLIVQTLFLSREKLR